MNSGAPGPSFEMSRLGRAGLLRVPFHEDVRGSFTKPYSRASLGALSTDFEVVEVYWSASAMGTVRGLHFQRPPTPVRKLVFLTTGRVRDVVVDVRPDSPTFGEFEIFDLSADGSVVFVPLGFAHGFEVIDGPATMCYLQDAPFDPETDAGVRWDSVPIPWRATDPILSDRDRGLPALASLGPELAWPTR